MELYIIIKLKRGKRTTDTTHLQALCLTHFIKQLPAHWVSGTPKTKYLNKVTIFN